MKFILQLLAVIITTFLILFATSFLLDLEIIATSFIRKLLIYIFMIIESSTGILIYMQLIKTKKNA